MDNEGANQMEAWRRELYHFGISKRNGAKIGSGRYPLGSGERPRAAQLRLFNKEKQPVVAREKKYTDDEWSAEKKRAVEQGDVVFIQRHADKFTPDEISKANSNYNIRKQLSQNANEVKERNKNDIFSFLDKFNRKSKTLLTFVDTVDKGLSVIAKWSNASFDDDSNRSNKKNKNNDKNNKRHD